jgi:hypothetical protein
MNTDQTFEQKLLVDSHYGIYVAQCFVERYNSADWHISAENEAVLREGPDHEDYWEVWDEVLSSAYHCAEDGKRWTLMQDCDLFAISGDFCED